MICQKVSYNQCLVKYGWLKGEELIGHLCGKNYTDDAIAPFAEDEIAALLLVYMLIFLGEAMVDVDRAAVTSKIWTPQRAFFVGWQEEGSFTYASRSNSIPDGGTKESKGDKE
jgi:hypothetical protein